SPAGPRAGDAAGGGGRASRLIRPRETGAPGSGEWHIRLELIANRGSDAPPGRPPLRSPGDGAPPPAAPEQPTRSLDGRRMAAPPRSAGGSGGGAGGTDRAGCPRALLAARPSVGRGGAK